MVTTSINLILQIYIYYKKMNEDLEFKELLIKSSQTIFDQLGSGHNEKIYHKALKYELDCLNIKSDVERHVNVIYIDSNKHEHVLESERIDMYIFRDNYDIILELKAISGNITSKEIEQINKYFRELKKEKKNIKFGIIINFPQPTSKEVKNTIEYRIIQNDS